MDIYSAARRIELARRALVADGYFTADEVDDDVAPRISELSSHLRQQIRDLEAQVPGAKLMRLRVLELPHRKLDDVGEAPFMLILDRCPAESRIDISDVLNHEAVTKQLGARGALVFTEEVELG